MPTDWDTITTNELRENATYDQGLGEFLSLDGWIVEDTGGLTMVAYYYDGGQPTDSKGALAVTTSDDYDDNYQVWLVTSIANSATDDILIRNSATLNDVKKLAYLLI